MREVGGMLTIVKARTVLMIAVMALMAIIAAADEGEGEGVFYSGVIFESIKDAPQSHGGTLTELPGGGVMAAWYSGSREKGVDVAIYSSVLKPGERKWSTPAVLHDAPGLSEGNPVLYTDKKGRVWFFYVVMYGDGWTTCRVHYKISADGGATWSDEKTLIDEQGWMTRYRPLELADGTFLLPIYNEIGWSPAFMTSADGGETWKMIAKDVMLPGTAIQPTIIERADGSILSMLRSGAVGGKIWRMESRNGGKNWLRVKRTALPNPNAAVDMARLADGRVALLFNDSLMARTPLTIAVSEDQGETWKRAVDLETEPHEFSYPAVIQTSDGMIHVVYTYKRTHIKHAAFDPAWLTAKLKKRSDKK